MIFRLCIQLYLIIGLVLIGNATVINGVTIKEYKGKTVNLVEYSDFLTKDYKVLAESTVDTAGLFNFDIPIVKTQQAIIQIGYLVGIIYLDPNQTYTIYFPSFSEDGTYRLSRNNVNLKFKTIPKNDINGLILEFDRYYDQFLMNNRYTIRNKDFHSKIDTFKTKITDIFKGVNHSFFTNYVKFSIANLELISPQTYQKLNLLRLYNSYIVNNSVNFKHPVQMNFLKNYYEKSLKNQIGKVGQQINKALTVEPSFMALDTSLKKDYLFKMEVVREFAIVDNLYTLINDEEYDPNVLLDILYDIKKSSKNDEIKLLSSNIINKIIRLQPGTQAIDFKLIDKNNELISLSSFKGKYVYINFWAIWSKESISEMMLFSKMKEEYGDLISFVSINIDSKKSKFDNYIASHQEFDWTMLYCGDNINLLDSYEVFSIPHYLLIDPEGKIVQAPASSPSPNNFETIDRIFFNIKKKSAKKKRFNIGIK